MAPSSGLASCCSTLFQAFPHLSRVVRRTATSSSGKKTDQNGSLVGSNRGSINWGALRRQALLGLRSDAADGATGIAKLLRRDKNVIGIGQTHRAYCLP